MEYRRRKKGRSTRSARGRDSAGFGSTIISLILISGIVYIIVTSGAGEWIAREVMAPLFTAAGVGGGDNAADAAEPTAAGDIINLATAQSATQSANAQLDALNCYMLQMGVFSSIENAQKEAERLRALGAAGYILSDTSSGQARYRVMASGYADEQSAKSVKERLAAQGTESAIYALYSPQASFKVTADEDALQGICAAFAAFYEAVDTLGSAAIRFDKEKLDIAQGKELCAQALNTFDAKFAPLASAPASGTLGQIIAAYNDCRAQLEDIGSSQAQSIVDFSSALKYTHLYIAARYAALVQSIAAQ